MKKFIIVLIISIQLLPAFGQGAVGSGINQYGPNVIPPPPNSASLGMYGQVPLNQFTGNPSLAIPLFEIGSNSLKLPLSLSYSSDAVKVDQFESNTGMGWVLNAGGVVTRQVFDYQDNYNGRLQKPNASPSSPEMTTFLDQTTNAPQVDTQPDIFSYNINGLCGKFFLDNNNVPVEIEPSGLKIEITPNFLTLGFTPNTEPEIIITDTKGIKYYFGGTNAIESSFTRQIIAGAGLPPSEDVKTSWYITKIEDPSTNNQIVFRYDSKNSTYISGLDQNLNYSYYGAQNLISTLKTFQYKSTSTESILKEITASNSKITFTYSKRFTDLDFSLLKLDEISYLSLDNTLIKKVQLDYTQYVATAFPNAFNQENEYIKKRFFLNQIKEFSNNLTPTIHKFEYYSPENLPIRFSFAQDNYGVFNGQNNSSLISDEIQIPNSVVSTSFADEKLANRRPNKNVGYYGLLKKITYPTKGETVIEYEPHVKGKETIQIYPAKSPFRLNVQTNDDLFTNTKTLTIHSSTEQTIKINGSVSNNCPGNNPFTLVSRVEIIEVTTSTAVNFFAITQADTPTPLGPSYSITANPSLTNVVFTLEANKDYLVKIKLSRPCINSGVYFNYYTTPVTTQEIDKEIGGYRVSRITKNNINSGILEKEKYFYSPLNCLTCQSGSYIAKAPVAFVKRVERNNFCETPSSRIIYSVGSSNLSRLYSSQNAQFGYEYVTKSFGDNFENGAEETRYLIVQDGLPVPTQGVPFYFGSFTNGFNSGKIISNSIFTKSLGNGFVLAKTVANEYFYDTTKDKNIKGYAGFQSSESYAYLGISGIGSCPKQISWDTFSLSEYTLRSQWHYLKKSIEKTYDANGFNPIEVTKNYYYENPTHLQLSREVVNTDNDEVRETKYYYPQDQEMQTKPNVSSLISKNIIGVPLKTEVKKNGEVVATQEIQYGSFPSALSGQSLLLPEYFYAGKGITTEKKVTYDSYDSKGNITQYTPENGVPISLIYGYNKTQPIAKIENATYSSIESQATNLQAISNSGSEETLITALNNFRTSLPNAMVTTYTYKPLIGVSTITDPKGDKITYSYDSFGRLQSVTDKNGNVLSENQYNYRPN